MKWKKRKFYSSFFCSTNFSFAIFTFLLVIFWQFCREICILNFPYYLQEFYRIIFRLFLNSTNIFANRQNNKIGKKFNRKNTISFDICKKEKKTSTERKNNFSFNFFSTKISSQITREIKLCYSNQRELFKQILISKLYYSLEK